MSLSRHPVHLEFQEKGGTPKTEARHNLEKLISANCHQYMTPTRLTELSALLEHPNSPIVLSMGGKVVTERGKLFRTQLISKVVV